MTAGPADTALDDGCPPEGRIGVVLLYPPSTTAEQLERIRAISPRIDATLAVYEEPPALRSARSTGRYTPSPDHPAPSPATVAALAEAHAVLCLDLPTPMSTLAPDLRWVQTAGAGLGHYRTVELPAGLTVSNGVGLGAPSISEFVFARLLQVWKRLPAVDGFQAEGRWEHEASRGRTLDGSTMVIVGLGAIGTAVAALARAFGVRVLAVRRNPAPHPLAERVVGPDQLHELLGEADAVVVCAASTDETESMFDAAAFAAMKPGVVFCNVARGALVDEAALIAALGSGHVAAAALDVTRVEPLPEGNPLWSTPGVLLSPHSSTATDRYDARLLDLFTDNLARWVAGQDLRNRVDLARGY